MNILYTANNFPLLELDNGDIYPFTIQNADILVGELSLDKEACDEIKLYVLNVVKETTDSNKLTESSTPLEITQYIAGTIGLADYYIVNEIIDRALKTYKMLTTPKPYDTWVWDHGKEEWVSPRPYPQRMVESDPDKYIWSDDESDWVPAEPSPHKSWRWNHETEQYEAPVPYPLDADPGEFIWDESKVLWVIND